MGTTLDEAERILAQASRSRSCRWSTTSAGSRVSSRSRTSTSAASIPDANKDQHGRLRVAAAIGAARRLPRARQALIDAGVDALDRRHGARPRRRACSRRRRRCARRSPTSQLVAGNVATREGARALVRARRGRGEGRRRAGLDLHDARRHRRRRAAAHRGVRRGGGRGRRPGHRRRRHQVLRRRGEGARRRRVAA